MMPSFIGHIRAFQVFFGDSVETVFTGELEGLKFTRFRQLETLSPALAEGVGSRKK